MQWVLFGVGLVTAVVALALGQKERRDFARFQEEAGLKRPGELEEMSLVVADLQEELARTAERITGELEQQAAELRRLIEEARAQTSALAQYGAGVAEAAVASESSGEAGGSAPQDSPAPVGADSKAGWRSVEAKVLQLRSEGLEDEEIARRLAVGKGEVKLILNLQKAQAR